MMTPRFALWQKGSLRTDHVMIRLGPSVSLEAPSMTSECYILDLIDWIVLL